MERFAEPVEILNPEIWNVLKIHVANYRAKWAKIWASRASKYLGHLSR